MEFNPSNCPFCGGKSKLVKVSERVGYDAYQHSVEYFAVECAECGGRGPSVHVKYLVDFTKHTVEDFRKNPILRARVEEDYENYVLDQKAMAVGKWDRRIGD